MVPSCDSPGPSVFAFHLFDGHYRVNLIARHAILALSVTIAGGLSWPSLHAVVVKGYHSDQYTYALPVLPICLALAALKLKATYLITERAPIAKMIIALAVMLIGLAAWRVLFAQACNLSINIFALVCCWLGLVIACYGVTVLKRLLFPLLFLFLMVPISAPTLGRVIFLLQGASLKGSLLLFKLAGVPVLANGFVLSLPCVDIEIAQECSGIRSSTVLLLTGLVLQYRGLRSCWTRVLFVLSIVPLAIAKNAIRIFTLSVLAIDVSPDFLEGHLHHEGGVVFFLLALALLLLWLKVLQRAEAAVAYWCRDHGHA